MQLGAALILYIVEDSMCKVYPFCLNSKRWITVLFVMNLPKSCPHETEKDCEYDKCAYYERREASPYLLKMRRIMKLYGMDIIIEEDHIV